MIDTRFLRGSDGTGNAIAARVNTTRIVGATVLKVDAVTKWPTGAFIATVGTLNSNGYLDPNLAPITEFRGHVTAGDIIIDAYEPGYTDVGNAVNQYVILKQTTGWSNLVQDSIAELQTEDQTRALHTVSDFIQTGGIWTFTAATLTGAMTAVTGYQAGLRATLAALASRTFTASKDTYVDLLRGGTALAPTFTLVYSETTNGGTVPVLAANSIRLAKVVSGASAITSITQTGWGDGIGNLIRPVGAASSVSYNNPVRFRVANNQTVGYNGTGQVYTPDVKLFDTANAFNLALGEFTAPYDGNYDFSFLTQMSGSAATGAYPALQINTVNYIEYGQSNVNGVPAGMHLEALDVPLKAGDKVRIMVVANSTFSSVPSNSGGRAVGHYNWFSGRLASR